ncbi:hypothetical protein IFM89_016509 [Coptis chinensis]|uniref:Uncharacterized protein n=1 Tax=Coptis chinensis TaxID=261450 RepID=A0A835IEE3_9MAGN|nr:hypothetical protein IFM89_016509 [Coptis chinensis]
MHQPTRISYVGTDVALTKILFFFLKCLSISRMSFQADKDFDTKLWIQGLSRWPPCSKAPKCGYPVFLSEFRLDQRGGNVNGNRYFSCILGVIADLDMDWVLRTLQGDYYLSEGKRGMEEIMLDPKLSEVLSLTHADVSQKIISVTLLVNGLKSLQLQQERP